MAKIPREYSRELPPVTPLFRTPGYAARTALARAGQDIHEMGQALEEAHRVSVFNRKISQASVDLLKMQEKALDDTDYSTMPERYTSAIEDYKTGMLADIDDAFLSSKVALRFDEIAAQKLINIRSYARKGIVAEGEASVTAAIDALTETIVKTTDPQERASYIGMAEGIVRGGTAAGYYYADREEKLLDAFKKNLPVKQVEHDLFTLGPSAVFLKLSRMGYPDLEDEDRVTLLSTAHAMLTRQEGDYNDYLKEKRDNTEMEMWSLFADHKLTRGWLDEQRAKRVIDPEDYEDGIKALITGIWPEDHIFSTPAYKQAHSFLLKNLQISGPGAEVLYQGELQYIAEAERYFQDKVGKGQEPWEAVDETLERYPAVMERAITLMAKPKYGPTQIKTLEDIENAKVKLGEAVREGKITKEQAAEEFEIIINLQNAIVRMAERLEAMEDLDKKLKKRKR